MLGDTKAEHIVIYVITLSILLFIYILVNRKLLAKRLHNYLFISYTFTIITSLVMMIIYDNIYKISLPLDTLYVYSAFFTYIFTFLLIPYLLTTVSNTVFYGKHHIFIFIRNLFETIFYLISLTIFIVNFIVYIRFKLHIVKNFSLIREFVFAKNDAVLDLSLGDKLYIVTAMLFLVFFICLTNYIFKRYLKSYFIYRVKLIIFCITLFLIIYSQLFSIYAKYKYSSYVSLNQILPFYFPISSRSLAKRFGFYKNSSELKSIKVKNKNFNYPLKPIKYSHRGKYSILMIVVEELRSDFLTKESMPNVYSLINEKNTSILKKHFSNGNNTLHGTFSLLYGIIPTYFNSALGSKTGSLLVDSALKDNYDMQILSSAPISGYPELSLTAFINYKFKPYRDEKRQSSRDIGITKDFLTYLNSKKSSSKFFAFLFYDTPHGGLAPKEFRKFLPAKQPSNLIKFFLERDQYINFQKNGNFFVDHQIGSIIKKLKRDNLYNKTIIVITGDHGEEYNENGDGIWGHNINFDKYQTNVAMIIHYPNKEGRVINSLTSHQDISPTILKNNFGVTNDVTDFSTGVDIFSGAKSKFVVSASYVSYAVITDSYITTYYGGSEIVTTNHSNIKLKSGVNTTNYYKEFINLLTIFN